MRPSHVRGILVAVVLGCLGIVSSRGQAQPAAAPAGEPSKVVQVTLFRGQAEVIRRLEVRGNAGAREIVVTPLPARTVAESLYAEGTPNLDIRAVRLRARTVGQEPREEVRALDQRIRQANDQLEGLRSQAQVLTQRQAFLDRVEAFVADTAKNDLAKGVLDAVALEKLTALAFTQREKTAAALMELKRQDRDQAEQLAVLQSQRAELTSGATRRVMEAVVFVEKRGDAAENLRLGYLVDGCGWSPTYNVRADWKAGQVRLEYNALINQMSGEDWDGVNLTLSTATPALSAAGPGLAPLRVILAAAAATPTPAGEEVAQRLRHLQSEQRQMAASNALSPVMEQNIDTAWRMNAAANEGQILEMLATKETLSSLRRERAVLEAGPTLTYPLAVPVSLASRPDVQMVRITASDLKADFYHVAMPVLTPLVYREALVANSSDRDLLGGPVTAYLDGRFVGRTEIGNVARGQSVVIGLGADPQLRATREMLSRDDRVQGGNQLQQMTIRLAVENYREEAVRLRLMDRIPYVDRGSDLKVELALDNNKISEDAEYLRLDRPKGILRWDIDVPAKAFGAKAHVLQYGFTLEYDRNLRLGNPDPSQSPAQREEYQQLQQKRMTK